MIATSMATDWRAQTVVVTGSSGSGKSAVCLLLHQHLGALVLNADEFARDALKPGSPALAEVRREFGERFFEGGILDRKALAGLVFHSPEERIKLEKIV